ncbi:MAG: glucose-phosphate thymidylyltransferase [Frankiales bacterium]|jgi:glucose-1-phosphate thymidylyltransferase|nr:glucose-phosphate thymidylyltransferase [Frankiales bacterium]
MKALVLAGGAGTRLRPLTHTFAKQLVPVANKPVLFYGLESLAAAGVRECGIIVGDTEAEIRGAVGDGSAFDLDVTYLRQDAPLGLAHAVLIARDFLGDSDFVMYLGDNFIVGGIRDIVDEFRTNKPDAQILLTKVSNPSDFGVAELDANSRVVRLVEKPAQPKSDLALVGVYLFTSAVHAAVQAIRPSARGELEITDAIQWLVDNGSDVHTHLITGYWKDTGNVTDMLEVNRSVLERMEPRISGSVDASSEVIGRVVVEAGAEVRGSRLVGPLVLGADTLVVDSYIGPFTSIADRCVIRTSEIAYSIVLEDSTIEGLSRVDGSLIGRHVKLERATTVHRAHRFILGDNSEVQISS